MSLKIDEDRVDLHENPKPWERRFWSQAYRGFRLGAAFGWAIGCFAAGLTYVVVTWFFN